MTDDQSESRQQWEVILIWFYLKRERQENYLHFSVRLGLELGLELGLGCGLVLGIWLEYGLGLWLGFGCEIRVQGLFKLCLDTDTSEAI